MEQLVVWIRISRLPIEYYDKRVLTLLGNGIRKIVKMDKKTLLREIRKYARFCIHVDLTKLLLTMFFIKGGQYKVEYERLHLLCLNCLDITLKNVQRKEKQEQVRTEKMIQKQV